jgi:hypothetical protein
MVQPSRPLPVENLTGGPGLNQGNCRSRLNHHLTSDLLVRDHRPMKPFVSSPTDSEN